MHKKQCVNHSFSICLLLPFSCVLAGCGRSTFLENGDMVSSNMDLTPKVSAPMCWSLLRCCRATSLLETLSPNDDDDDELEDLLIRNELSSTGGTVVTTQHCAIEKEKSEGITTRKRSVTFEDDQNHSFTYNDKKNDNDNNKNNNSQSPSTMNATNDGVSTPNYYDIPDIEKYNNNNYNAESHDNAPHEMNLIHSSSSSLSSLSPRGGEVNLIQFALLSMLSSGSSIPKRGSVSTITMTYDEYDDTIPDLSLSIDDEF